MSRRDTGALGEKLARDYVRQRGYDIIETNYRSGEGEVDIVARDRDYLVFIEVRAKRSLEFGIPEESITPAKIRKLKAVAAGYLQSHDNLPSLWRIDVVAVELGPDRQPTRIELIENAVSQDESFC